MHKYHTLQLSHQKLLKKLKKAADIYFLYARNNSYNQRDNECFFQFLLAVEAILLNGLREKSNSAITDFLCELDWLYPPNSRSSYKKKKHSTTINSPNVINWIKDSLENCCLCSKIQLLLSEIELVKTYFNSYAYLRCNAEYSVAFLVCLSSIELNQSNLLCRINESLYSTDINIRPKRSSSNPHFTIPYRENYNCYQKVILRNNSNQKLKDTDFGLGIRLWKSLPNLHKTQLYCRIRSKTVTNPINIPINNELNRIEKTKYINDESPIQVSEQENSFKINMFKCEDIEIHFDKTCVKTEPASCSSKSNHKIKNINHLPSTNSESSFSNNEHKKSGFSIYKNDIKNYGYHFFGSSPSDLVATFLPLDGEKITPKLDKNIFEDINELPVLDTKLEQSLAPYLEESNFFRNNTELEKENAHFSLSEALISAIEYTKCTDEIKKKKEPNSKLDNLKFQSTSCVPTISKGSEANKNLDEDNSSDIAIDVKNLDELAEDCLESHTTYAAWSGNKSESCSAESVALSLLATFQGKASTQVPDINWLVSEKDVPQELLPMPPISANPDDNVIHSFTRGTRDWAPPRPQVIFTSHNQTNLKTQMHLQNYRCAGCGMRVAENYINRYRYCTYLGKYHCSGCHRNQMANIPAKILEGWDFKFYPVSVFSYRLIEKIWNYPLFFVPYLNKQLYANVKCLSNAKRRRIQLNFMYKSIFTCRFAIKEKILLENVPQYWIHEVDRWSMADFIDTKSGSFQKSIISLLKKCEDHIIGCVLCTGRGFYCELCLGKTVIYPWQNKVKVCNDCGACFHEKCWNKNKNCGKCERIRLRMYT